MYRLTEKLGFPFIDEIIIAEDSYIKNYVNEKHKVLALRNYPILSYAASTPVPKNSRVSVVYVGGIARARGALELVEAIGLLKPKYENILLTLVGPLPPDALRQKIKKLLEKYAIQNNVNLTGSIKHEDIYHILASSHIGVAILHPEPNYTESLPTKLFEYMVAGLPVIASNFPLWKEIIEGNKCGICVDPLRPKEIAGAVEYLVEHPMEANNMGENGRKAVLANYNWEQEGAKLLDLYQRLTAEGAK
jgi:glycosyltransferase involved in cell wall biosynthesis